MRLTRNEFFCGFFAALALQGHTIIYHFEGTHFHKTMAQVFKSLTERTERYGLDVRFRIRPHSIHGDSTTIHDGINFALSTGLITTDSPAWPPTIRIHLSPDEAERLLAGLPGNKQLYIDLAKEFLDSY